MAVLGRVPDGRRRGRRPRRGAAGGADGRPAGRPAALPCRGAESRQESAMSGGAWLCWSAGLLLLATRSSSARSSPSSRPRAQPDRAAGRAGAARRADHAVGAGAPVPDAGLRPARHHRLLARPGRRRRARPRARSRRRSRRPGCPRRSCTRSPSSWPRARRLPARGDRRDGAEEPGHRRARSAPRWSWRRRWSRCPARRPARSIVVLNAAARLLPAPAAGGAEGRAGLDVHRGGGALDRHRVAP